MKFQGKKGLKACSKGSMHLPVK